MAAEGPSGSTIGQRVDIGVSDEMHP